MNPRPFGSFGEAYRGNQAPEMACFLSTLGEGSERIASGAAGQNQLHSGKAPDSLILLVVQENFGIPVCSYYKVARSLRVDI